MSGFSTLPDHPYDDLIREVSDEHDVDEASLTAMIWIESNFDKNARSASSAVGLGQVIYRWHSDLTDRMADRFGKSRGEDALYDPQVNLHVTATHLSWCIRSCGDVESGVLRYFSGQCDPPLDFTDGQQTSAAQHIAKFRDALAAVREASDLPSDLEDEMNNGESEDSMSKQRYILSMGHRNTNRGGARGELDWTPGATRALRDAIVARGGEAIIIQEVAGGNDRNWFNGGLQAAARACVDQVRSRGPFQAYLSVHHNGGAGAGFHAIFPDGANDTKAMNPLDVRVCRAMRDAVAKTNTMGNLHWTRDSPGVMSERETGVGERGFRLGEFVGTLGFRNTTARIIMEAGSIDVARDAKLIRDANWIRNVYSEALVDGLEAVFGKMGDGKPVPMPTPEEEYANPDPIAELADRPAYVKLDNGAQLIRVDHTVEAVKDTPRLRHAWSGSVSIGPDVKKGQTFEVDYLIINADGTLYWHTPWSTRIKFEEAEIVPGDVDG